MGVNRNEGIVKDIDCACTLNASDYRGLNRNQTQNAVIQFTDDDQNGCFIDLNADPKIRSIAACIKARYNAGISNHKGSNSGVFVCDKAVLPSEQCKVLLKIKEATKKGYAEACPGDCVDFSFPQSKNKRGRVGKDVAHTLMTSCTQGMITGIGRIRKLTPLECFRLQGFTDEQFYKAQAVNSDNQLYKQIGNGVTVPVIYAIGQKLWEVYYGEN
jgi:DNA (cytosine-5)-methyltransferase 1